MIGFGVCAGFGACTALRPEKGGESMKRNKRNGTRVLAVAAAALVLAFGSGCGKIADGAVAAAGEVVAVVGQVSGAGGQALDGQSADGAEPRPSEKAEMTRVKLNLAETADEAQETEPEEEPQTVSLVFAGDILFDDSYAVMASMKARGAGIEGTISDGLLAEMRGADIFMVNNEFPYTDRGTPTPGKTYTFRAKPKYASYLLDMGADIVSLANNHAYDYGEVSLTDTIDTLKGIGMPFVGAGRNIEEASKPVYLEAGGMKIAFVSATQIERTDYPDTKGATETTPGVFRCRNVDLLLQKIAEAKEASDFVVVYIHWGTEGTDRLDAGQTTQAVQIAAAGADLIIGDHPHVLQPIGFEGEIPVVYSLGNFLFNSKTRDTCLVKAEVCGGELKSLQFIPAKQANCKVAEATGSERERILAYMRKISPEASIDADGYVTKRQE